MARPRMNKCAECRKRKKRCDGQQPGCTRDIDAHSAVSPNGVVPRTIGHGVHMGDPGTCSSLATASGVPRSNIFCKVPCPPQHSPAGTPQSASTLPLGSLTTPTGLCTVFGAENGSAFPSPTARSDMRSGLGGGPMDPSPKTKVVHQTFRDLLTKVKRSKGIRPGFAQQPLHHMAPLSQSATLTAPLPDLRPAMHYQLSVPAPPSVASRYATGRMTAQSGLWGDASGLARPALLPGMLPVGGGLQGMPTMDGAGDLADASRLYHKPGLGSTLPERSAQKAATEPCPTPYAYSSDSACAADPFGVLSPEALEFSNLQTMTGGNRAMAASALSSLDLLQGEAALRFGLMPAVGGDTPGRPAVPQDTTMSVDRLSNAADTPAQATAYDGLDGIVWENSNQSVNICAMAWPGVDVEGDWAAMVLESALDGGPWDIDQGLRPALMASACLPAFCNTPSGSAPDLLGSTEA